MSESSMKLVGTLVALLIIIIIAGMVYYSIVDNTDQFSEVTDTTTGYSHGDNASAWSIYLDNSPDGTSNLNITCYSATAGTLSYPSFTLSNEKVSVAAGAASNFTQVNATYTSKMATAEEGITEDAGTVFSLLPIIALVVVASVILLYVIGFGGGRKGGM